MRFNKTQHAMIRRPWLRLMTLLLLVGTKVSLAQAIEPPFNRSNESTDVEQESVSKQAPETHSSEPKLKLKPEFREFSAEQIKQWVADLDSDRYIVRRTATEKLIEAGRPAIEPVAAMLHDASLEAITRGVRILQELAASSDFDTESAAFEALERIAQKRATAAGRRANLALVGLSEYRRERSIRYLKERGAVIGSAYVRDTEFTRRSLPSITFDQRWTGTVKDIRQLRWVLLANNSYLEPMFVNSKWLVVFNGKQFNNDWIKALAEIDNVMGIRVVKTSISAEAIGLLPQFDSLRYFDVFYTPLDESAYPAIQEACQHFANVSPPFRMRLYGTGLDNQQLASFGTPDNNVSIDARRGGFLGISCDPNGPCRITYIGEGSAAQAGGLQIDDVIEKYNGHDVDNFDTLMDRISENAAGDRVEIVINRIGKKEIKHVTLGEWEP